MEGGSDVSDKTVEITVYRYDPSVDDQGRHQVFAVPLTEGMSVMDALDYIYDNLDGSLAYYDHAACNQGICHCCLAQIDGKASLMCQTLVRGDVTIDPLPKFEIVKDLVTKRGGDGSA
ncbi:succinate dehydrogenase [bacterium]|nr:succinate dehydrogenase [bacterium]